MALCCCVSVNKFSLKEISSLTWMTWPFSRTGQAIEFITNFLQLVDQLPNGPSFTQHSIQLEFFEKNIGNMFKTVDASHFHTCEERRVLVRHMITSLTFFFLLIIIWRLRGDGKKFFFFPHLQLRRKRWRRCRWSERKSGKNINSDLWDAAARCWCWFNKSTWWVSEKRDWETMTSNKIPSSSTIYRNVLAFFSRPTRTVAQVHFSPSLLALLLTWISIKKIIIVISWSRSHLSL